MRLRNIPRAESVLEACKEVVKNPESLCGHWNQEFQNERPLHIEIGMGKGQFITTLAQQNPEINYIGIEKYSSVLIRALEKTDALETLPENLRFVRMDAENICNMFAEHEVDRIYLNFSDPWPKDRHAKRRLTSTTYLGRYDKILKPEGHVEFKTDNKDLFQFSLEQVEPAGWHLDAFTWDLHHDETLNQGNVMTEYEQKFSSMGNPICKLIVSR